MAQTKLQVCLGAAGTLVDSLTFESTGNREHSVFQCSEGWPEKPRQL